MGFEWEPPCPSCGAGMGILHAPACQAMAQALGIKGTVESVAQVYRGEAVASESPAPCNCGAPYGHHSLNCTSLRVDAPRHPLDEIHDAMAAMDRPAPDMVGRAGPVDQVAAQAAVRALLLALGYWPDVEGLRDTPRRVAAMWAEFLDYDPGELGTSFEAVEAGQLVVVSGMRVWSMCEHHLLPFWCDVAVGYLAQGRVLGLSKLGRLAHQHAHRLQLQERLVAGIAADLALLVGHEDVAVVAQGEHLCMTARGIRTPHRMTSSSLRGAFLQDATRAEFLALAGLTK